MQDTRFYRLGIFIYRFRWVIIGLWLITILACLPFLSHIITPFTTTGFIDEQAASTRAEELLNQKFGYSSDNKFLIIYNSKTLIATSPAYQNKIKQSLATLKTFPIPHYIILPELNEKLIAKNQHISYAIVIIKSQKPLNDRLLNQFKAAIKTPTDMTVEIGGKPLFIEQVNEQTQKDLYKADFVAAPLSIIVLILVFGTLFAALLPVILGGGCALIILTLLYFLGHVFTLSIFTLNIALLLGLCLSLDYSLFVISRFRDELKNNDDIINAIAITQATAGKAILFSGLTVFASLSALLLFPINILFSVAIGGLTAVFIAVITAIILLPAVLAVMKTKINAFALNPFYKKKIVSFHLWHWIAQKVVARPMVYFLFIFIFLLTLGYPFLSAKFGVADFRIFPEQSKPRHFYDVFAKEFNEQELNPILMLVQSSDSIVSQHNLTQLNNITTGLKKNPLIAQVNSIVTLVEPNFTPEEYYDLYNTDSQTMDDRVKLLLGTTTRDSLTVITLVSKYPINSTQTKKLINELQAMQPPFGMHFQLTGTPVSNKDLLATISHIIPYAIAWIIFFTYLILLVLLRSIFLPLKAILMNILSLSACYGALVLVFQDGYLHQLLNFQPQGILDISLLVIIFCALFGFSMDYEVFLLSRIKECYDVSGDNKQSIIFGIEKSSQIITSAAVIVISICFSFLVADVLMVKVFGLGIAVAIFVDAFLIRILLVPATMILINKWNWYLPQWLNKMLPNL
jgi:RND superfamily putative drug exporter